MSSIFNALLTRCTRTAFASREDIVQCTVALLELCKFEKNMNNVGKYSAPIKRFARREKTIVNDAVSAVALDGFDASNGLCAVLLSQTLADNATSLHLLDTVRCKVIESTQTALLEQTWPLQHLRMILYNLSRLEQSGVGSNSNINTNNNIPHSFFTSFTQFIANRVELTCSSLSNKLSEPSSSLVEEHVNDVSLLISMATLLPSMERETTMQLIAKHTAALADVLPITTLGHLCAVFNQYKEQSELLAVAMQEEADRIANDGDAFAVVHAFRFIGAHKAEVLSSEALQWLMERLISEEFDAESLVQVCATLCCLPQVILHSVASEWMELIAAMCVQMTEILTELYECTTSHSSSSSDVVNDNCKKSDLNMDDHSIVEQLVLMTTQLIELRTPLEELLLLESSKHSKEEQLSECNQVKILETIPEHVPELLSESLQQEKEEHNSNTERSNLAQREMSTNHTHTHSRTNVDTNVFDAQEAESNTINITFPESYTTAINKCVRAICRHAAKFAHLNDAQLHEFVDQLMVASNVNVLAPLREATISLLQTFASQNTPIPIAPLRVFQYMTFLCNVPFFGDSVVCVYFLKYFSKKVEELSIMQLCTVLKCLAWALQTLPIAQTNAKLNGKNVDNNVINGNIESGNSSHNALCQELVEIELAPFLRLCAENVWRHCSEGVSIRCMLCIIAHMHLLGYTDDIFYNSCTKYLMLKIKAGATADDYCPYTVNVVRDALQLHGVEIDDALDKFCNNVIASVAYKDSGDNQKEKEKNSVNELCMSPEIWIKTFDYNYCSTLRSEESLECVQLLEEMISKRSDESDKIRELGTKYIEHITSALPADHVTFFNIFATKVLKEDKLLKLCLEKLIEHELVSTLSGNQIALILNSLATVHCIYVVTIKKFLSSMKVEQWNEMEVADVVRLLDACSRLCIRVPAIIDCTCKRLTELSIFLSPIQLANAIYSLQALGCANQEVLQSLTTQASKNAKRFDEASISILFSVPSFHRLIRTPEIATPLLHQACSKISSAQRRRRIALNLRQSSLPRTLIESQTSRLLAITDSSTRASMLLLQASKK